MTTVATQQEDEILTEIVTCPIASKEEVQNDASKEEKQNDTTQTQDKEQHWLTKETHLLPKNNIWIVLPGLF